MILIVTYDLKGPAGEYTDFYEALKQQGSWWHYLRSTWLISTGKNPNEVFKEIKPYLGLKDRVLIAEMGDTYNGWLPKSAWEWVHKQKSKQGVFSGLEDSEHFRQSL